jgi:hypothetical protein
MNSKLETHTTLLECAFKQPLTSLSRRSLDTDARCSSFNTPNLRYTAQSAWCDQRTGPRAFNVVCQDQNRQTEPKTGQCGPDHTCYQIPRPANQLPDIICVPANQVEKAYSDDYAVVKTPDGSYQLRKVEKRMNFDAHTFDVNGHPILVRTITQFVNGHFAGSREQTNVFDNDYAIGDGDLVHFEADKGSSAYVILQWTAKVVS